jgi:glycosyltransferase involved in cell wall biosynthesis
MGRFSPEKGLAELARDWPADEALDVIGSGPELGRIAAAARGKNITIVPTMDRSELRSRLSGYLGFVFPSLWFEVAPQVALEAMRVGLPIVAHEANAVSELVESTGCGAIYHDRESLRLALGSVTSDRALLHRRAVEAYDAQFSEEEWLRSMTALYSTLIKDEPDALG